MCPQSIAFDNAQTSDIVASGFEIQRQTPNILSAVGLARLFFLINVFAKSSEKKVQYKHDHHISIMPCLIQRQKRKNKIDAILSAHTVSKRSGVQD